jgi:hypothetical protein
MSTNRGSAWCLRGCIIRSNRLDLVDRDYGKMSLVCTFPLSRLRPCASPPLVYNHIELNQKTYVPLRPSDRRQCSTIRGGLGRCQTVWRHDEPGLPIHCATLNRAMFLADLIFASAHIRATLLSLMVLLHQDSVQTHYKLEITSSRPSSLPLEAVGES